MAFLFWAAPVCPFFPGTISLMTLSEDYQEIGFKGGIKMHWCNSYKMFPQRGEIRETKAMRFIFLGVL